MIRRLLTVVLILLMTACIDRVMFDIGTEYNNIVVIQGIITNAPGPYRVTVGSSYQTDEPNIIYPSVSSVVIADNLGNSETLAQSDKGNFTTSANGIRGVVGRAYHVEVELADGRKYSSTPDTLFPPGVLDTIYTRYATTVDVDGSLHHSFDLMADGSRGEHASNRFVWKAKGTFQADTRPDLKCNVLVPEDISKCEPCGFTPPCRNCNRCNFLPLCSGWRNYGGTQVDQEGTEYHPIMKKFLECTCCSCWFDFYNERPLLSTAIPNSTMRHIGINTITIPVNQWVFMHKVHLEVSQMSVSKYTHNFWVTVEKQREAVSDLFQPIVGNIPTNMKQTAGNVRPAAGIFYAAGVSRKILVVDRFDLPAGITVKEPDIYDFVDDCRKLFPNGAIIKPDFY